jgi:hypothetical protein
MIVLGIIARTDLKELFGQFLYRYDTEIIDGKEIRDSNITATYSLISRFSHTGILMFPILFYLKIKSDFDSYNYFEELFLLSLVFFISLSIITMFFLGTIASYKQLRADAN